VRFAAGSFPFRGFRVRLLNFEAADALPKILLKWRNSEWREAKSDSTMAYTFFLEPSYFFFFLLISSVC
jgi:hypothetical protein